VKNKYLFFFVVFLFNFHFLANAQIGGNNTYEVLKLTSSPRVAGMGGDFLAIYDNDISLVSTNPSLINPGLHNHLGASFVNYFAGINYGQASYSRTFNKASSFAASMQYIDYGSFDYADESGIRSGQFYAGESLLNLGWGRQLDTNFMIGSSLKFIYSSLESYTSYGLAVDVAGSYVSDDRSFVVSFIAKNIGRQLKSYDNGNNEALPFELQFGLTKRLNHLPFRYSVLYNHLEKWDLSYDDPDSQDYDPISGEATENSGIEKFADNFMRHIVFGGELLIGKNLSLQGGYNYKRRQEMKITDKSALIGFSWGIGIRISKFHFNYARSAYHLAGSPNYILITTNFSDFFKKSN
jgi:hypothetical protein